MNAVIVHAESWCGRRLVMRSSGPLPIEVVSRSREQAIGVYYRAAFEIEREIPAEIEKHELPNVMSPVTHFFTGWVFANCFDLERKDRALITLACVAPDIDGLGIIPELLTRNSTHPLLWFSLHHHSLHSLMFALVIAAIAFAFAAQKWKTGLLALLSFHLHLFEDMLGSRGPDGYQWPIPYLAPFSSQQYIWRGQWGLNAWPNVLITIALLLVTLWLAWRRGYSPLEMVSARADGSLVAALRRRFPARTAV